MLLSIIIFVFVLWFILQVTKEKSGLPEGLKPYPIIEQQPLPQTETTQNIPFEQEEDENLGPNIIEQAQNYVRFSDNWTVTVRMDSVVVDCELGRLCVSSNTTEIEFKAAKKLAVLIELAPKLKWENGQAMSNNDYLLVMDKIALALAAFELDYLIEADLKSSVDSGYSRFTKTNYDFDFIESRITLDYKANIDEKFEKLQKFYSSYKTK